MESSNIKAWFPERSKGRDLRSRAQASWVRIPHHALSILTCSFLIC